MTPTTRQRKRNEEGSKGVKRKKKWSKKAVPVTHGLGKVVRKVKNYQILSARKLIKSANPTEKARLENKMEQIKALHVDDLVQMTMRLVAAENPDDTTTTTNPQDSPAPIDPLMSQIINHKNVMILARELHEKEQKRLARLQSKEQRANKVKRFKENEKERKKRRFPCGAMRCHARFTSAESRDEHIAKRHPNDVFVPPPPAPVLPHSTRHVEHDTPGNKRARHDDDDQHNVVADDAVHPSWLAKQKSHAKLSQTKFAGQKMNLDEEEDDDVDEPTQQKAKVASKPSPSQEIHPSWKLAKEKRLETFKGHKTMFEEDDE